ncbi:MAG: hypothetical protein K0R27_4511 [Xanthobacteraceae bacterium]|jgi:hypothetical protein|nr:hypothetical protein [Xanthobacteraceae bacterium]
MTGIWLYVMLTLLIIAGAYGATWLFERSLPPGHPGE